MVLQQPAEEVGLLFAILLVSYVATSLLPWMVPQSYTHDTRGPRKNRILLLASPSSLIMLPARQQRCLFFDNENKKGTDCSWGMCQERFTLLSMKWQKRACCRQHRSVGTVRIPATRLLCSKQYSRSSSSIFVPTKSQPRGKSNQKMENKFFATSVLMDNPVFLQIIMCLLGLEAGASWCMLKNTVVGSKQQGNRKHEWRIFKRISKEHMLLHQ